MDISVYGINFKNASIDLRERLSLSRAKISLLLHQVRKEGLADEAMILQTCNRVEYYLVGKDSRKSLTRLLERIADIKSDDTIRHISGFYHFSGREAVQHIFRTGASLDSQVVGETEILGQLKKAYRLSLDAGAARFILNKTLHHAFGAAKRVHTETELCKGAASVAAAAAHLVKERTGGFRDCPVLVIGAGKTAGSVLRALLGLGAREGFCANRSVESAAVMFDNNIGIIGDAEDQPEDGEHKKHHGRSLISNASKRSKWKAIALDDIPAVIDRVGAIVSATSAEGFVIASGDIAGRLAARNKPLHVIDIAVPRDVDPALAQFSCVHLYTIEDLDDIISRTLRAREAQTRRAEALVKEEVERFYQWVDSLRVAPTIRRLKEYTVRHRENEMARNQNGDDDREFEKLRLFAEGMCAKFLHKPFEYLNRIGRERSESEVMEAISVIHELFDLDRRQ